MYTQPILMTASEFKDAVRSKSLTDAIGKGFLATPKLVTRIVVLPSDIDEGADVFKGFSHVLWITKD